jgi:hypothetical protein
MLLRKHIELIQHQVEEVSVSSRPRFCSVLKRYIITIAAAWAFGIFPMWIWTDSVFNCEIRTSSLYLWCKKKRKLRVRPGNVCCVCFVFDTNFSVRLSLYELVIFVLVGKMIGQWTHIDSTTQAKWCPGDSELLSTILQQLCEGPWWSWTLWPVRTPAFGLERFTGGAG